MVWEVWVHLPRTSTPIIGQHLKLTQHSGKWTCRHRGWAIARVEEVGEKTKRTLALCKLVEIYGRPSGSSYRATEVLSNITNTLKRQEAPTTLG